MQSFPDVVSKDVIFLRSNLSYPGCLELTPVKLSVNTLH